MKTKDIIVGTLAVVGGVYLAKTGIGYAVNKIINNISYVLGKPSVSLHNIANGNITITLPVTILNSNLFTIKIDGFFGDVAYGLVPLGNISVPGGLNLLPNEAILVELEFTVNLQNTINGVFNAAYTSGFGALLDKIYLVGEIVVFSSGNSYLGEISIPIETSISII